MLVLLNILSFYCVLIKEMNSNLYIISVDDYLRLGNIAQAVDFQIIKIKETDKFFLTEVKTKGVVDYPTDYGHFREAYLNRDIHGKHNQQVSFVLNRNGSFNIIINRRKAVYDTKTGYIIFISDFTRDDGQFILVDRGTPYFKYFKALPIEGRRPVFDELIGRRFPHYGFPYQGFRGKQYSHSPNGFSPGNPFIY